MALKSDEIVFAKVDCTAELNTLLCMAINIDSFPTILLFSTNPLTHLQGLEDHQRNKPLIEINSFGWDKYRANSVEYRGTR
jgi:hypothetical protein